MCISKLKSKSDQISKEMSQTKRAFDTPLFEPYAKSFHFTGPYGQRL